MTEHNAIETIVAESYRTKIDAEDLRREVKALLNEAKAERDEALAELGSSMTLTYRYFDGQDEAYTTVLRLIDEKERGR